MNVWIQDTTALITLIVTILKDLIFVLVIMGTLEMEVKAVKVNIISGLHIITSQTSREKTPCDERVKNNLLMT